MSELGTREASSLDRPPCVLVGVGGGIAAYKVAQLVSRLAQRGINVRVAMSEASEKFVGATTFAALSGRPVIRGSFAPDQWPLGAHIESTRDIDLFCVAPASADLIGKFSAGIADTLLTTIYLQAACPVLIAPAMSNQMWAAPAVARNIAQLKQDGVHQVGPEEGWLSCRQKGLGRMSEPETIYQRICQLLNLSPNC